MRYHTNHSRAAALHHARRSLYLQSRCYQPNHRALPMRYHTTHSRAAAPHHARRSLRNHAASVAMTSPLYHHYYNTMNGPPFYYYDSISSLHLIKVTLTK
jgi:hypothetical protein